MASSNLRVWVSKVSSRGKFVVRWRLPCGETGQETVANITGKKREDAEARKDADARAKELRQYFELPAEPEPETVAISWHEARKRYEVDYLPRTGKSNATIWRNVANAFARSMNERGRSLDDVATIRLADIESCKTALLSRTVTGKGGEKKTMSTATVDTYIATLRAGFSWFAECEWRDPLPAKRRGTKKKQKMRGRPLTSEEVERFCIAVPKVISADSLQRDWAYWIEGLYLSGLRIMESLSLTWDDPAIHQVRLGRIPKINFAPSQKNRSVQVVATTPDFATFLARTPEADRHGFVFNPRTRSGRVRSESHASRCLSDIGEEAKLTTEPGRTASAHDLRRSFGSRWSLLVMPPVLQHMMRHASIETTMRYYVDHTADLLGREIKEAFDEKLEKRHPISFEEAADAIRGTHAHQHENCSKW